MLYKDKSGNLGRKHKTAWRYFVSRQRRLNYQNFRKNCDCDMDYERLKKAGVFKSPPAEKTMPHWDKTRVERNVEAIVLIVVK
jgi:hypothetical protein